MIAPAFWYRQKTLADFLWKIALTPAAWGYAWLVKKRFDLYFPVPLSRPVLCVGNLVAGGAGKTPMVLALSNLLQEKGYNPHLLTRGYGGTESGPLQVSPGRDTAADVGDEALLLVESAPTWVSSNRPLGAQQAIDSGANIIVMDDGFQNPVIYKDFALLVVDGAVGIGNTAVIPAGPLRESLSSGLARADAVLIIGEDKTKAADLIRARANLPVLSGKLVRAGDVDVQGKKVVAFAGIGRPGKLKETLEEHGAEIIGWTEFPDHFPYDEEDLKDIVALAEAQGAMLVTTSKDHVRLPEALRGGIEKFAVRLVLEEPDTLFGLIEDALRKRTI